MQSKKSNGDTVTYEFPYMRKPKGKTSIWRGIYNPDKNYILGRTPRNWGNYKNHLISRPSVYGYYICVYVCERVQYDLLREV